MFAAARLDAGLFVCRNNELIAAKGLAVPLPLVEIQDAARLGGEIRIAREDPTAMPPGTDGVFMQPAPDRASAEGGDQASLADVPGQIGGTPTGERQVVEGGQFTGQRLYLHDQIWGEKSGADPDGGALPGRRGGLQRTVCATC